MELLTKEQVAEMAYRPLFAFNKNLELKAKCINEFCKAPDYKIISVFRREVKLNLCKFAPGLFYIKYDN